jgi:membrane protease YdiL (CAAX protease family)
MNNLLLSDPYSTMAFAFFALGTLSLWFEPRKKMALAFLGIALFFGVLAHRIDAFGVGGAVLLGGACYGFYHLSLKPWLKAILGVIVSAIFLSLAMHLWPGFRNWLVLENQVISKGATPIKMYINFDKSLISFFVIGWGTTALGSWKHWKTMLQQTIGVIAATCFFILGLGLATGYVRIDLKWFEFSALWLFVNLLFACVSEEAFFRGFLQVQLEAIFNRWKWGHLLALGVTSVLFGLTHYKGGWMYVALASIAGLFYGYAFHKTKRIEASILTHFCVNAIHFACFSYPHA